MLDPHKYDLVKRKENQCGMHLMIVYYKDACMNLYLSNFMSTFITFKNP